MLFSLTYLLVPPSRPLEQEVKKTGLIAMATMLAEQDSLADRTDVPENKASSCGGGGCKEERV